jgi:hypothetical protein
MGRGKSRFRQGDVKRLVKALEAAGKTITGVKIQGDEVVVILAAG